MSFGSPLVCALRGGNRSALVPSTASIMTRLTRTPSDMSAPQHRKITERPDVNIVDSTPNGIPPRRHAVGQGPARAVRHVEDRVRRERQRKNRERLARISYQCGRSDNKKSSGKCDVETDTRLCFV